MTPDGTSSDPLVGRQDNIPVRYQGHFHPPDDEVYEGTLEWKFCTYLLVIPKLKLLENQGSL